MAKESKKKTYGNESISSLKGADRVRLRPAVIFGSDGLEGCEHSFFEILSNSIDEAREGYGDKIIVTRYRDQSIEVEDFARGVPVDFNEREGRYNWELVFCELYAGGKYNNDSGENYEYSLGLNGLGACATQYSSEFMDVTVYRDATKYTLHFEKGENLGGLQKEPYSGRRTGTIHRWRPDLKVFTEIDIPVEFYEDTLKKQAIVNAGLKFIFRNETADGMETKEFLYENGILDYVKELAADPIGDPVVWEAERRGRDRADMKDYKVKMNFALVFTGGTSVIEYYHNSSFLEHGGSPDKAVKTAFVWAVDNFLKQNSKYNKNEAKVTYQDIFDSLVLVSSSFSTQTSYENQTKKAINNKFIQECMTEFLKHQLEVYFIENKLEADKIAERILVNKRSRESAEKARINVKKKLLGNMDISNRVQKFVDCRSKDVERRELFIVEGDSALGSCKMGRDAEFQAIIPVRGKILNCLKAEYDKIFKSEIILDIMKVLGCGVEVQNKKKEMDSFDLGALRWSKIIICTDADVDGFQIRTLILTMIYRLVPTLIQEGKVFIVESPLFEITCKGKSYFAYNEKEKVQLMEKLKGQKYTLQRSKGLGENEPDMMWETTMNPETRRLIRVEPEDAKRTSEMFDVFLGNNLEGRKEYISENGYKYIDLADIS